MWCLWALYLKAKKQQHIFCGKVSSTFSRMFKKRGIINISLFLLLLKTAYPVLLPKVWKSLVGQHRYVLYLIIWSPLLGSPASCRSWRLRSRSSPPPSRWARCCWTRSSWSCRSPRSVACGSGRLVLRSTARRQGGWARCSPSLRAWPSACSGPSETWRTCGKPWRHWGRYAGLVICPIYNHPCFSQLCSSILSEFCFRFSISFTLTWLHFHFYIS